jgi:hypothetical protein
MTAPCLVYGNEIRKIRERNRSRLQASEMRFPKSVQDIGEQIKINEDIGEGLNTFNYNEKLIKDRRNG